LSKNGPITQTSCLVVLSKANRSAEGLPPKLGADGGIGDHIAKPKWMRWPTYDRKLEEVFAAEEVVDAQRQ
jgi:hypothetical protein